MLLKESFESKKYRLDMNSLHEEEIEEPD